MKYHHFIITRFNVNIYDIDFPKRLEPTWLAVRFDLFQKFCFPTLAAQRNKDFTWLVLFDEQTPAVYKKLINAYSRLENFVPVYCGAYNTIMGTVREQMKEIAPEAEWYLTTRLDNDDALSVEFVDYVQRVANTLSEDQLAPADTLFINFPNGLQYCEGEFYDFKDETNAFVSLMERKERPRTVFGWTIRPFTLFRRWPRWRPNHSGCKWSMT